MTPKKIAFAGSGHGGLAALSSLQNTFSKIEVLTGDADIVNALRPSDRCIDGLEDCQSEMVVCAGYHEIVPKTILEKKRIINTHPSLLPRYRGMHGLVWAMLNFERYVGFSIHVMNEFLDDGPVLEQFEVEYDGQTSAEIMASFDEYVRRNLGRVITEYVNGDIEPKEQDKNYATWVCKRNLSDCVIDFSWSNKYIRRLFKALVRPYPLPMLRIGTQLYEINRSELVDVDYDMHLGRVVNIEDSKVFIKTRDGILIIDELISMKSNEYMRPAALLKMGQRL